MDKQFELRCAQSGRRNRNSAPYHKWVKAGSFKGRGREAYKVGERLDKHAGTKQVDTNTFLAPNRKKTKSKLNHSAAYAFQRERGSVGLARRFGAW